MSNIALHLVDFKYQWQYGIVDTKRRWSWLFKIVCFSPYEIKLIEDNCRMSSGDYRFIPSPESRNVHAAVRKVFLCCSCFKIRISIRDPVLQINVLQMELIKGACSNYIER